MIRAYAVNMEKDIDKREHIKRQLDFHPQLDYEIIKAVEGRKLSNEDLANIVDLDNFRLHYGHMATLPALGCSISHKRIYEKIVSDLGCKYALIVEDDALLSDNLAAVISEYESILLTNTPTVILLTPDFFYRKSDLERVGENNELYRVLTGYMTSGYMINRAGAQLIKEIQTPVRYLADDWNQFKSKGLILYGVIPHAISFKDGIGEIGRSQLTGNPLWGWIRLRLGRLKGTYSRYKLYRKGIRRAKKVWK